MGATERATAIQAPADGKDTTFRVSADDRLALSLNPPTLFCEAFAKCVRGGGLG